MGRLQPELHNDLAKHRKAAGFTQEQLAQIVAVSRQTIASIENGTYNPSTVLALRLAMALVVPLEQLFWLPKEGHAEVVERRRFQRKGDAE